MRPFKLTPRAHISVTAGPVPPALGGGYALGVAGRAFTSGGNVRVEVRRGDIGGPLVKTALKTVGTNGQFDWGTKPVPCGVDLAVSAWDQTSGISSNAESLTIACE